MSTCRQDTRDSLRQNAHGGILILITGRNLHQLANVREASLAAPMHLEVAPLTLLPVELQSLLARITDGGREERPGLNVVGRSLLHDDSATLDIAHVFAPFNADPEKQ